MRPAIRLFILAAFAASFCAPSRAEAANAPLCFAIAENYNKCLRQHQRGWHGGPPGFDVPRYGHDHGDYDDDGGGHYDGYNGGYGGGYGGHGGHGGYGGGYGRRNGQAQAQCAIWLAQMQASGCFN